MVSNQIVMIHIQNYIYLVLVGTISKRALDKCTITIKIIETLKLCRKCVSDFASTEHDSQNCLLIQVYFMTAEYWMFLRPTVIITFNFNSPLNSNIIPHLLLILKLM